MNNIRSMFKDRKGKSIEKFRKSSVMILLTEEKGEIYLVFEKRALSLRKHPGDVSLPGGGIEEGETPKDAAIRETFEELNINKENFQFIGEMDYLITPFNSIIYAFVGRITTNLIYPNKNEVDHVFKVPLKFFLENKPKKYEGIIKQHYKEDFPFNLINGGKNYKFSSKTYYQYFYKYNEYIIWGFTAMIIKRFIDIINNSC
ncbi:hydrolase [Clostridium novyi B str. ATCC 27606]|uniref:Hydrolase n=2 Tax=Clostridium TaxID=1485 RepID=A0AA40IWL4_CLONO|nr:MULTISPECIES: CoA pyrophosphatase [Clostridium]KEI13827.1 hydrolase [Clostridium novyi B str. NCTC 9691]KEI16487.1 hydrolase [Clostridium haemolyticum NCTC 9693]KEI18131.1 hydrolase [Clostridium novyi B str. ATCC 27606]KGN04333.1 hydrolase [Clostridium haemolyticum NCTC 8350]CAG7840226.1 putative Nudix hydrolase NudL [Clostridium haemolyticum]